MLTVAKHKVMMFTCLTVASVSVWVLFASCRPECHVSGWLDFHPAEDQSETMETSLGATGGGGARAMRNLLTVAVCLLPLLLLQPADCGAARSPGTRNQTGPRLQLSHSGRKHLHCSHWQTGGAVSPRRDRARVSSKNFCDK